MHLKGHCGIELPVVVRITSSMTAQEGMHVGEGHKRKKQLTRNYSLGLCQSSVSVVHLKGHCKLELPVVDCMSSLNS